MSDNHRAFIAKQPVFFVATAEAGARINLSPKGMDSFRINVESVQTSCGWGVPHMAFARERDTLNKYHAQQDPVARIGKVSTRTRSIDGLPVAPPSRVAEF
jgi:hypothetical protein